MSPCWLTADCFFPSRRLTCFWLHFSFSSNVLPLPLTPSLVFTHCDFLSLLLPSWPWSVSQWFYKLYGVQAVGWRRCWHPEWQGGRREAGQILPHSLTHQQRKGGDICMWMWREEGTERQRLYGEGWGRKIRGVSTHPTQSSTPFHPSSVSAQRLPLLHQHQLLVL